ncbi:MAG: prolipoprotein diacylglyceryl transferase [Bdellovibrionales bacterium]|nr:prolipoprotein diacylglyceryl transferase [Bdellovibrionales bacterium]
MTFPYIHDIDPFAIQLWGNFGIRWYGLAYLTGFVLGYLIISWMQKRSLTPLPAKAIGDFVFWIAVGTVAGGRLGYCLFYRPELFVEFTSAPPFWGVFAVNKGGMASHGGMIGIVVACILFARKHHQSPLHLFDLTILAATLGIFFGRIANFINGELVGRICPADFPLAVKFPQDILSWPYYEPQRLAQLADVVALKGVHKETWASWVSQVTTSNQAWNSINSTLEMVVASVQNGNEQLKLALGPLLDPRYPSQLFAALLEGGLIFLILMYVWRKPRKPGVITALFFILYAIGRIINEQFRLPDLHIGYQLFSLTRGQWLSIGLLAAGLVCYFFWSRAKRAPLGGWAKRV